MIAFTKNAAVQQNLIQADPASFLHSKLMPPRSHPGVIPREALFARLDAGLTRKLTLVSAPTGFGKTTLVSAWLAERKITPAWVNLDANDNDPARFWGYVIMALRKIDSSIGKSSLAALNAPQPASIQSILTPVINELADLPAPSLLVLEDYQAIAVSEIHNSVSFFLQNIPEPLHLLLISRSDPDLPLGILRARDELVEIITTDLRFSPVESEIFLNKTLGGEVPRDVAVKLRERSEGWAAGLRLAALWLQRRGGLAAGAAALEEFSGSQRYVADYVLKEVFESQPEKRRNFLLHTCFLKRLTGSLCDAVTGSEDGDALLEQLERDNLFLVRLEHGRGQAWYRYDPLFAEAVQSLARQRMGEAGVLTIFEKASAWYEYYQMLDEAIEAALEANLYERAIVLVERYIDIYSLNEMSTLHRWMERIPLALALARPQVCLTYAQVILFSSDRYSPATAARIEPYLRAAEEIWVVQGKEEKVGAVLAIRGMMLIWQGEFQKALGYVYASLEKLSEGDVFYRGMSLLNAAAGDLYGGNILVAQDRILEGRALMGASQNIFGVLAASGMMSEVFYAQGDGEQAVQLCQQVIREAVGEESMLDDQANARLILANVAYEENDLEASEGFAREALALGEQRANEFVEAQAAGRLAAIQAARGEVDQAFNTLKVQAAKLHTPLALREVKNAEAAIAVQWDRPDALGAWPGLNGGENQSPLYLQQERETYLLARLRIAAGKPEEALALVRPLREVAGKHGRTRGLVEGLCVEALAHQTAGNQEKAGELLSRALALGQEKKFRRLFLDEGKAMAALLREAIPNLSRRSLNLYAVALLRSFTPEEELTQEAASVLLEPISPQELRVLRYLAAGLSNAEIARELVVSQNTVKTHVKNIYRKLNINSREEARQAAREMKLL
jgi:LuxR family maltose regulon positive regulatory protein